MLSHSEESTFTNTLIRKDPETQNSIVKEGESEKVLYSDGKWQSKLNYPLQKGIFLNFEFLRKGRRMVN